MRLFAWIVCPALVLTALAACGGSRRPGDEPADFGADVAVRSMIVAQQKCNAAGVPDLYECAEARPSSTGERLAARAALDMYQLFQQGCLDTTSAGRCEALVEIAYRKASAQQTSLP
jgi:hypothetical protein